MNYRDITFKALWTGIAAVLGYLLTALDSVGYWWGPIAVMLITAALAFVRQRTGETPADLGTKSPGS